MNSRRVKAARVLLGISQTEMGAELGISRANYKQKENGISKFSDEQKAYLAKRFGWSLEDVNEVFFDGIFPTK